MIPVDVFQEKMRLLNSYLQDSDIKVLLKFPKEHSRRDIDITDDLKIVLGYLYND